MVSCKVRGCKNRSDKPLPRRVHYFSFPKDEVMVTKWLAVCKKTESYKHARICSLHFKASDYKIKQLYDTECKAFNRTGVRTLLPSAVPTLNIGPIDNKKTVNTKQKRSWNTAFGNTGSDNLASRDHFQQSSVISSSTPLKAVKCIKSDPNLDDNIGNSNAPAHVLDHQYTGNINLNNIKTENANNGFEILPEHQSSDQETILQLKKQLKVALIEKENLEKTVKRMQATTKTVVANKMHAILSTVFSAKQIDKLLDPYKTKIKWTIDDIISAITLQNISLKAYCHLREKNYPLPGLSTIRKWASGIKVSEEGLLVDVLTIMKCKARSLSVFQKIIVLNFCETRIANKNCHIVIARGLFYEWVQPIYYSFERPMTSSIIKQIISSLYVMGYIVVAITYNLESFEDRIWVDLNIGVNGSQECFFVHPKNKDFKVFVFPHDIHLLILIRTHFLYNGFIVKDKCVNKQCLEEIININRDMEEEEYHVIKLELITDYECNKENYLLTKQLFSKTTAEEICRYGREEMLLLREKEWEECAYFFESLSEWVNLFDSKEKEGYEEGQEPYGLNLDLQNNILSNIESLMKWTKVQGFENSSPFQEQVVLSCLSLQQLLVYLQEHFSIEDFQIKYILTNRLSSQLAECFVAYLNGEDTQYNMTIAKFQYRLRKFILGKYSADLVFNKILRNAEPCLIDFNERSDNLTDVNEPQRQKAFVAETAEKMRKFLTDNDIPTDKVHKNLLHIINKRC